MIKLTDLEICKLISMMELKRQFPEAKTIEFNERQNCFWVEAVGFTSWPLLDPLTDDALCFKLMVKYKVSLDFEDNLAGVLALKSGNQWEYLGNNSFDDTAPNEAILLAIIEAHKEQLRDYINKFRNM